MALAICISVLGLIFAPALVAILVWSILGVLAAVGNGVLGGDGPHFVAAGVLAFAGLVDLAALVALVWWITHLWTVAFA